MSDFNEPVTTILEGQTFPEVIKDEQTDSHVQEIIEDIHPDSAVDDVKTTLLKVGEWTVAYRGESLSDELLHAIEEFPEGWEEEGHMSTEIPSPFSWSQDGAKKYYLKDRTPLPSFWKLKKGGGTVSRGYLSVGLELAFSKTIRTVLQQDSVQQFVKERGFSGIRYIEPICALIPIQKPEVPRKCVIYPFVKCVVSTFSRNDELEEISDFLKTRLKEVGIDPEDLLPRQFIIDAEGMLWLIDTEGYAPIPANGKDDQNGASS